MVVGCELIICNMNILNSNDQLNQIRLIGKFQRSGLSEKVYSVLIRAGSTSSKIILIIINRIINNNYSQYHVLQNRKKDKLKIRQIENIHLLKLNSSISLVKSLRPTRFIVIFLQNKSEEEQMTSDKQRINSKNQETLDKNKLYSDEEINEIIERIKTQQNCEIKTDPRLDGRNTRKIVCKSYKSHKSVSYTHLTLPTICSVQISVGAVSLKKKRTEKQNKSK
eukprot:TRINITY_DN28716_c0_g1_i1.p1 TRINITY_DN28716_c0_g1~~TRINITY_DN28716_c0_g1_i1.p1  ORF type:complete len:223 (-),score=21.19 TRINITY_DN28716_c0_g1_i1:78-746(-)